MKTFEQRHHRPKPPVIRSRATLKYQRENPQVVSVFYYEDVRVWVVEQSDYTRYWFNTWRDAINFALQVAYE